MYTFHIFSWFLVLLFFGLFTCDFIREKQYRLARIGSERHLMAEVSVESESTIILYDNAGKETAEITLFADKEGHVLASNCSIVEFAVYFSQNYMFWLTWNDNYLRLGTGPATDANEFAALENFSSAVKYVAFLSVNGTSKWNILSIQKSTVEASSYTKRKGTRVFPVSKTLIVPSRKGNYPCLFLCNEVVACLGVNILRSSTMDGPIRCEMVLVTVRRRGVNCSADDVNQLNNHFYRLENGWTHLQKKFFKTSL